MSKSKKILNELDNSFLKENKIIFKKYKPIKKIGTGAFGKIYSTVRIEDKSVFAMKVEKRTPFGDVLKKEAFFLFTFKGLGIPQLITYGRNTKYNILIETLLGESLYDIFIKTKKPCNIFNICLIAIQVIERLEFIHSKDYIYRDVKPENLMIGIQDPNVIYIIDYGLCKKYRSSKTGKHIQPKNIKKFIGTLKYSSSNVVRGKEASRRDDLISLGFVLIYLYKRQLPWGSKFNGLDEETYLQTIHQKETFDDEKIFKYLPNEMVDFLKYVNKLGFEEDPNYSYMKKCFEKILSRLNFNNKVINFSWIVQKNSKLVPKLNLHRRGNSRIRLLKSLENNRKNKTTLDNDYSKTSREIGHFSQNTFDENINKNNENKNNNIIDYQNKTQALNKNKVINIRNKINPLKQQSNSLINKNKIERKINPDRNIYINNNNKNIVLSNINLGNEINKNMNFNITYHRKVNTFAPNNIYKNKISKTSNIENQMPRRGNNNNTTTNYINNINIYNKIDNNSISNIVNNTNNINYPINKGKPIFNLNNNFVGNKRSDTMSFTNNNNLNALNSTDINKKMLQYKKLNNRKNLIINNFNSNNIKNDNFNPKHKRSNAMFFSNVNTVHLHNFTDVY